MSGDTPAVPNPPRGTRLPETVWALGWVSLLTDVGSEMVVPLLPAFLAALGASMLHVGLLQGASEAAVSLLKMLSGWLSDRQRHRKPWLVLGYGLSTVVRPLMALAQTPLQVVMVRSGDRIGKGLRAAPRDALIADSVAAPRRGEAFGLQRSMDHAGALAGAMVASSLLFCGCELRAVFALALLPGIAAVLLLLVGVRELPRAQASACEPDDGHRFARLLPFLTVVACAGVGGAVDLFALARASELGVPTTVLPLLWAVLHAVRAVLARPLGALSDRLGRRRVIGAGLFLHTFVMLGFAAADNAAWSWPLFAAHGLHAAFSEGAERAYVAGLLGAGRRGRAFGVYHAVQGASAFAGPLLLGAVWDESGSRPAFVVAASASLLAVLLLATVARPAEGGQPEAPASEGPP
jgi:MFS family permease